MNRRYLFGLLLLLCSSVSAGDRCALLIGVSKYKHTEMNKPEPLKFPEEDAKALANLLKAGGYDVETLLGKDATREAVDRKLSQLSRKGSSDGVALIGLFGHGVEIETRDIDNKAITVSCFCPFDTDIQIVKDTQGRTFLDANGRPMTEPDPVSLIKLSDLMMTLKIAKAGNRVVLADCCRLIPNQARGRSFGAGFRAQDLPENTSVLFGCSPNEKAFEHQDWGHGAFTKCLVEAITELSAKGSVDSANVAALLKKRVPELVRSVSPQNRQTPKFFTTDLVDLQLAVLSTSKAVLSPSPTKPSSVKDLSKPRIDGPVEFDEAQEGDAKELVPGIVFRWCPAGKFTMGSPGATGDEFPVEASLTGFWLGQTEVTQGEWKKVMGTTPWSDWKNVKEGDDYAASCISYEDAALFCGKLTKQERIARRVTGRWRYSLPTEAQWEYACRAGTQTTFSFESHAKLTGYGWYRGGNAEEQCAHRVGLKKPNAWGLMDMHGNVWEWCSDWYVNKLPGGQDPSGPRDGSFRVNRGGCWNAEASRCTSSYRRHSSPLQRTDQVGFRIAAISESE